MKNIIYLSLLYILGCPRWCSSKELTCQFRRCKRHGFNPWLRKIPWSRKWQPTPVFLPGKPHRQSSGVGYSPWGCKESDTTEWLSTHTTYSILTDYLCSWSSYFPFFSSCIVPLEPPLCVLCGNHNTAAWTWAPAVMSYGGCGGVHLIGFAIVSSRITLAESLLLWDAAFSCEVKAPSAPTCYSWGSLSLSFSYSSNRGWGDPTLFPHAPALSIKMLLLILIWNVYKFYSWPFGLWSLFSSLEPLNRSDFSGRACCGW